MKNRIKIEGNGVPVLLIHGMGGPKIWNPVVETLKNKFRLIIPTFPGFLQKDGKIIYSDELYVDFLINLQQYLNIEKWHIVGISMGGRTSLNYALRQAAQISSLTLIDSIGMGYMHPLLKISLFKKLFPRLIVMMLSNEKNRNKLAKQDFVNQSGEACKNCVRWFDELTDNDIVRQNFAEILAKVGCPQKEWNDELRKLNIPIQLLWASADKTAPVEWGMMLNKLLTGSRLHILDGYKHMAILEKPQFFIELIEKHIEKNQ